MNKSCTKWKSVLVDLGHPHVASWDNQSFNAALFRGSKERQELLNWLAPKILEISGHSKKFPDEIALQDVYSQFVWTSEEEITSFISGSLLKDKQIEIWSNVFWKIDTFRDKTCNAVLDHDRSPESKALIDRAHSALLAAEEVLNKPLPQLAQNGVVPSGENREIVSVDELLLGIKSFCQVAKRLDLDPTSASIDANLTTLKTLSEMAEAMKRMNPTTSS